MSKFKSLLILLFVFFIFFTISENVYAPSFNSAYLLKYYKEKFQSEYKASTNSLIKEVQSYINKYAKGSKIDVELLIKLSDLYEIDLKLVLAQGHLESHFGTRGKAAKTHSIFNVGTYDDGTILYKYKNPNYSIEPYMKLLKNRYLVNNKKVEDLLNDEFVNVNGNRYATQRGYEKDLLKIINRINNKTSIDDLIHTREFASLFQDKTTSQYAFEYQTTNNINYTS